MVLHQSTADLNQGRAYWADDLSVDAALLGELLSSAQISSACADQARTMSAAQDADLADILVMNRFLPAPAVQRALARVYQVRYLDRGDIYPDQRLLREFGADHCLRLRFLPMRDAEDHVILVVAQPKMIHNIRRLKDICTGDTLLAIATEEAIVAAILTLHAETLAEQATVLLDADQSCRNISVYDPTKTASVGIFAFLAAFILAPTLLFTALFCLASLALFLNTSFKLWATAAFLKMRQQALPNARDIGHEGHHSSSKLPVVSLLVPLFRETEMAGKLVQRLDRIDYPAALLDVIYLVEAKDHATQKALGSLNLPANMRILTVPDGPIRTKPRAMNFALPLCRGSIVGIYDAEDAPETDQILKIVARFQARPREVACLQARLDFYNTGHNWLSRCFTVEYATWFRVILPGLQALGMPIPLGGTSVFFRRDILQEVGAWDAHNVTEDADLGMRLARFGYKTELIDSTTYEEANCRVWPWIKQRSRWLKGYGLTYSVLMRQPRRLLKQVGVTNLIGLNILFLGTLSGFILAPILLSFWALSVGVAHPAAATLSQTALWGLLLLFVTAELVTILVGLLAVKTRGASKGLWIWVPTMHFYFPLASIGAFKAIYEIATAPFYWDKTQHGQYEEK